MVFLPFFRTVCVSGMLWLVTTQAGAETKWLAFGDIRGHLESCGCDPLTDLGGLNRLAWFLELEKKVNSPFLLFNLGNNLTTDDLKNKYILQFTDLVQPVASLLNVLEIKKIDLIRTKNSKGNYLLSNKKSSLPGNYHEVIVTPTAVIMGYVYRAEVKHAVTRFNPRLAKKWRAILRKRAQKRSYLLFAGEIKELQSITSVLDFSEIIISNPATFDAAITHKEKAQPQLLAVQAGKRKVYMTPLAGQGVLRGGEMMLTTVEPDLGKLLQPKKQQSISLLPTGKKVSWLDRSYEHTQSPLWQAYQREVEAEFKAREKEAAKMLAHSDFVGAAICQGCHLQAHKVWQNSKHATAMQTLITREKQKNSECVSCHSVGFGTGGFVSMQHSPHLANVQCENCHGARKNHILNPQKSKKTKTTFTCVSCHHPPHSPQFDQNKYWQQIKHTL